MSFVFHQISHLSFPFLSHITHHSYNFLLLPCTKNENPIPDEGANGVHVPHHVAKGSKPGQDCTSIPIHMESVTLN